MTYPRLPAFYFPEYFLLPSLKLLPNNQSILHRTPEEVVQGSCKENDLGVKQTG